MYVIRYAYTRQHTQGRYSLFHLTPNPTWSRNLLDLLPQFLHINFSCITFIFAELHDCTIRIVIFYQLSVIVLKWFLKFGQLFVKAFMIFTLPFLTAKWASFSTCLLWTCKVAAKVLLRLKKSSLALILRLLRALAGILIHCQLLLCENAEHRLVL